MAEVRFTSAIGWKQVPHFQLPTPDPKQFTTGSGWEFAIDGDLSKVGDLDIPSGELT